MPPSPKSHSQFEITSGDVVRSLNIISCPAHDTNGLTTKSTVGGPTVFIKEGKKLSNIQPILFSICNENHSVGYKLMKNLSR